ncbi:MAG: hypothetical protein ACFE8B_07485 [Candidatus Hermodarchaeota archaeon]
MVKNKGKKSTNETKAMDVIQDCGDSKKIPKEKKIKTKKSKLRLLANKETDKTSWTPEMRLGYCKHSMRKFVPLSEFQNPWEI